MRSLSLALVLVACSPETPPLEGEYGFVATSAIALQCPPDIQGQFMKVFVEGRDSSADCDMEQARQIPLTCEDRQAYLDAVPMVCLGAAAVAGPNLPMLDYLLREEAGEWVDFDAVPVIRCVDGEERTEMLWGDTQVSWVDDQTMQLDLSLTPELTDEVLLAGRVEVELCDLPSE